MIKNVAQFRKAIEKRKPRYFSAQRKTAEVQKPEPPQPIPVPIYVRLNRPAKSAITSRYLPQDSLGRVLAEHGGKWMIQFPGVIGVIEPGDDLIRIVE